MHPRTALFIQGIVEAAIPLYGYFEWNWDLSFILLFYLIDWILSLVLHVFKGRKRLSYSGLGPERSTFLRATIGAVAAAIPAAALFGLGTLKIEPSIDWTQRVIDFILYKDMGIQQGFILVPLLVLNGIMLFKQQFIRPALFERMNMEQVVRPILQQNLLLLASGGGFYGIASLVSLPETIAVAMIIAGITVYRTFFIRSVISYTAR